MKEYIKKFESLAAANGHIIDNPFTTTIVGRGTLTNLTCNQENKKIEVNGDSIDIVEAGPQLISFTIDDVTYQAEGEMTWGKWLESDYNTGGFYESTVNGWPAITDGNKYVVYISGGSN